MALTMFQDTTALWHKIKPNATQQTKRLNSFNRIIFCIIFGNATALLSLISAHSFLSLHRLDSGEEGSLAEPSERKGEMENLLFNVNMLELIIFVL